jgi:hypothetical protein
LSLHETVATPEHQPPAGSLVWSELTYLRWVCWQVLTDDLGWNTAWHNSDVISPTLDAMVKDSIEMTRHYVYRYCAPTRGRCAIP